MTITVLFQFLRWLVIIALAGFFCWMIYRLLSLFLRAMNPSLPGIPQEKPGIWIESNWGGLGGGLSGWRASNAATYLLLICLLLGCLVVSIFSLVKPQEPESQKQEQNKQKKDETAEQKGSAGIKADREKAGVATDDKAADMKKEVQPSDQKAGGSGSTDTPPSESNQQKSSPEKKEQH